MLVLGPPDIMVSGAAPDWDDLDDVLRFARPEESDEESCKELSGGEAENCGPLEA